MLIFVLARAFVFARLLFFFRYKYAPVLIAILCCKLSYKHECRTVVSNNPKLTIQQYAKTKATAIFIAITSTLLSVRRIKNKSNEVT